MSPTVSRECPICLEKLHNPVVTPCGHLTCEHCIDAHVRASSHSYVATCPTCRAPFPTVLPNLSNVPKKYHVFISPPLRRVYLADAEDNSRAVIDGLKLDIATLTERIVMLDATGKFWFEREREAQGAVSRLSSAERDARLALDEVKEGARLALGRAKVEARIALDKAKEEARVALDKAEEEARIALDKANEEARVALNKAEEEMRLANQRLEVLRSEYDALKSRGMSHSPAINTKRTSGQAALDDSPIRPLPKRAKLQAMSRTDFWTSFDTALSSFQSCLDSPLALFARGPTARTGPGTFTFGSSTSGLASQQMAAATSPGPLQ